VQVSRTLLYADLIGEVAGTMKQAALIIHGGAGAREGAHGSDIRYANNLRSILPAAWETLLASGAREAVLQAVRLLEDDPLFNAGLGSRLQRDGVVRMSAALMDGLAGRFSGVINVERVRHPIDVAAALGAEKHSVLAGEHATRYARSLGMPEFDPVTPHRRVEHERRLAGETGTVGAVAVDRDGRIWAATSTGGVGYETPGRVSDSPTVAGTYADAAAGISCTGVGEHIVDHAAAARVVVRVTDGLPLDLGILRTLEEADRRHLEYGLIAVGRDGLARAGSTTGVTTLWAARDRHGQRDFLTEDA
jgi:L-asparaginase